MVDFAMTKLSISALSVQCFSHSGSLHLSYLKHLADVLSHDYQTCMCKYLNPGSPWFLQINIYDRHMNSGATEPVMVQVRFPPNRSHPEGSYDTALSHSVCHTQQFRIKPQKLSNAYLSFICDRNNDPIQKALLLRRLPRAHIRVYITIQSQAVHQVLVVCHMAKSIHATSSTHNKCISTDPSSTVTLHIPFAEV